VENEICEHNTTKDEFDWKPQRQRAATAAPKAGRIIVGKPESLRPWHEIRRFMQVSPRQQHYCCRFEPKRR